MLDIGRLLQKKTSGDPGTDVLILKTLSLKNWEEKLAPLMEKTGQKHRFLRKTSTF
jgi:hypothetical protein